MPNKLEVATHLTDDEHRILLNVYHKHMNAMGEEERKQYALGNIKKVKGNVQEQCLEVYFKNGEWFKYFANGTWG
ncbi:hypothetical protein [Gracilibacillus dipsosauri]|uniref:Uncharacterized protein n=1 Tax=Gracilibacillus dipsosauri TaxID=178340 RepID=A0A317KY74_9BACI|nr:hypothetical protein [Gracilibacillus dipsosauri]PWU68293.1 hypothetical protein DLJ74_07510 [Gracilibacillus dipsosauri]